MSERREGERKLKDRTVVIVWVIVALALLGYGGRMIVESRETLEWPTVAARVIKTGIDRYDNKKRVNWVPTIQYEYEVAGHRHRSKRIYHGVMNSFRSKSEAEAWVARHALDSTLTVHYDPADPSEAVLYPQTSRIGFLLIGFGVMASLVALISLLPNAPPPDRGETPSEWDDFNKRES